MIKFNQRYHPFEDLKNLSTSVRLDWIFRMVLLGLSLQMLLSFSLWFVPNGVLPYLPIFFTEGQWLEQSSQILFPVFLILIILNLLYPLRRSFLALLFLTGILLIFGNIHRLQVWFYFYGLILFLFFWRDKVSSENMLIIIQGIIVGVYLWLSLIHI